MAAGTGRVERGDDDYEVDVSEIEGESRDRIFAEQASRYNRLRGLRGEDRRRPHDPGAGAAPPLEGRVGVVVDCGRPRAFRRPRGRRPPDRLGAPAASGPHATTLYSSAQARPSSVTRAWLQLDPAAVGEGTARRGSAARRCRDACRRRRPARGPARPARTPPSRPPRPRRRAPAGSRRRHRARPDRGGGWQHGRADRVPAGERPAAEVDALLNDAPALVAVAGDGHRQRDAPGVAVEVQDELLDAAGRGDDETRRPPRPRRARPASSACRPRGARTPRRP